MNIEKLKPWNWFKHEESEDSAARQVPVAQAENTPGASPLMRMHREMDRLFDELSSSFGMPSLVSNPGVFSKTGSLYRPSIDVSGDANSYEIKLDVPGMNEDDLSIEVNGDMLLIRGEKEQRSEDKDKRFYRVERSYGSFQRTLALPEDANADEISAQLEKGVLRLEIPRRDSASKEVKRIAIGS